MLFPTDLGAVVPVMRMRCFSQFEINALEKLMVSKINYS